MVHADADADKKKHNGRDDDDDHDNDVVAYIYPAVGTPGYLEAARSIETNRESPLYQAPRRRRPQVEELRHEREPTVDEDEDEGQLHDDLDYEACFRVTFDYIPKTRHGLRVGRGGDAELRLRNLQSVSAYHFALNFDADYCLIVQDLGSTCGTTVIYDNMERGRLRSFDWIVGGSDFLQKVNSIVVKVSKFLQFRLVVPRHDVGSKSYRDKVDRFCAGTTDAEQVLDLGRIGPLSRVETTAPSGARTPASGPGKPVTVYKRLGAGGFGVVYHVWNVSTSEQYALKRPKKDSGQDLAQWEKEIAIMERINHKHIVSLLNSSSAPSPWLHLEYMPEGSISDHLRAGRSFSEHECKQILAQASDALAYLHSQDPQIVHRDVKPCNVLILHRRPGDLFIKFADFGISSEGDSLKTICGTYVYLAPEIYEAGSFVRRRRRPTYTALVDIWSLGVVLAGLLCGLPKREGGNGNMGVEWCHGIREKIREALLQRRRRRRRPQDLLSFVLEKMLCLDPDGRKTAAECHKEALLLLDDDNDDGALESHPGEVDKHHHSDGLDTDTEASTILVGEADGSSSLSRYIIDADEPGRRYDRSCDSPSPETAVPLYVGRLLQKLRNPEDSQFCRSSFGETLESGCGTCTAPTVVLARDATEPRTELNSGSLVLAREPDGLQEDRLSEAPIREALVKALMDMASGPETCTSKGLSVKRSMAARSPGSKSPRALLAGRADGGGVGDGLSARMAKRNRTVREVGLDRLSGQAVI